MLNNSILPHCTYIIIHYATVIKTTNLMSIFSEVISGVFPHAVALAAAVLKGNTYKGTKAEPMEGGTKNHQAELRKTRRLLMVAEHALQGRLGHGLIDYGATYGRFLVLVTEVR